MSYRLDARRAAWFDVVRDGDWHGGPYLIVKGAIPDRYGCPSYFDVDKMRDLTRRVCAQVRRGRFASVAFGDPIRRGRVESALGTGAWVMPAFDRWYVDVDLIEVANRSTDRGTWVRVGVRPMPKGGTQVLAKVDRREVVAIVAPVWCSELEGPRDAVASAKDHGEDAR